MKLTPTLIFLGLICYVTSAPLSLRNADDPSLEPPINTNLFESFVPLPEKPEGVDRKYTFKLKNAYLDPDGVSRKVWTVNGQYPGPLIRANIGDRLNITVINEFGDPSTIHWHGLEQRKTSDDVNGTNWFDGVPGATQCPIPNGVTFSYVFTLTQSGTYWYHSHFIAQYVDGLKGPIVIHDPNDPYKGETDYEYVLTISDWYHAPTGDFMPLFTSETYQGNDPQPDSGEISGVGHYNNCTTTLGCKPKGFATYNVQKGKKYRFRIINMSAMSHFTFSIDNHPLTIIEVEGVPVKKVPLKIIPINIAQRYSVIVDANQPVGNYWMRAEISECSVQLDGSPGDPTINGNSALILNRTTFGILHYKGASDANPDSTPYPANASDCFDVNPKSLKPIKKFTKEDPSVPTGEVNRITLEVDVGLVGPRKILKATINNSSFVPSFSYPTNQKIIDGSEFITSDNTYPYYKPDEPIELLINNTEDRTHPFHLHGHTFWVVAEGEVGSYNQSLDSLKYNFDNPALRDTATVKNFGLLAIRYYANNPGLWLIHCHIEWHVELGMVAQMVELPSIFKQYTIPESVRGLCEGTDNKSS